MPDLQISDLPPGNQTDLTAEAEFAADVGSSHTTKKYSYTQIALALTLRGSVADALQYLQASSRIFKGYYSSIQPADPALKTGYLWYQGSGPDMPLGFPWTGANLKQWNGSAWVAAGASYTPDAWDGWADLNNGQGYYWFMGAWQFDDVNADGVTIEILPGGKLAVKDGGIDSAKLSTAVAALVNGALQKSGGTMTGALHLIAPTDDDEPARKGDLNDLADDVDTNKQDKLTSTGTGYLLTAPTAAGGQPGLLQTSTLATQEALEDEVESLDGKIDAVDGKLPAKANIIPGSHIDWNFHTTPVPAGRILLFDTSKTPSLSSGSIPTTAEFILIDSDSNKMFGFFTNDDGATTQGGLFHIDGDEFVLDRPVWNGTGWVNNGKYELQYGINPGPLEEIGDSTLNGFDMLTDISVEDIPARDLVDVENELKDSLSDDISENNRHRTFTTRATKELLANISTGFLVRVRIDPFDWSIKPYSDWNARTVDPQYVVEAEADLPGTSAAGDIAVTANGDVYTSDGTDWTKQNSNTLIDGWLFAETSSKKGFYVFGGEWNQLDFSIDWTQIVDGVSIGFDGEHIYVKEAGKVDSVNGIPPDSSKNVKTDYIYQTEADFEADKDNIPVGATVIKLYEYPENFAGFMAVPDYANMETTNRISTSGGTWVVDRNGFLSCRSVTTGSAQNGIQVFINDKLITSTYVVGTSQYDNNYLIPVSKGDVAKITGIGTVSGISCYFIPAKFVITPNAASVIGKLTPSVAKFIGQPDYKNRENTNRITASNGTWTVDRDGYVTVGVTTTVSVVEWLTLYINGVLIYRDVSRNAVNPDAIQTVVPVSKGDVITLGAQPEVGIFCYFIPPLIPPSLFVEGADLQSSTATGKVKIDPETKTMSVNGEIDTTGQYSINRPDLWPNGIEIDFGNNLYGMRKEGTISVTAGGSTQVGFGASATKFIDGNGEYQRGTDTVWHSVNGTVPSGFTSMLFRQGNIRWALNCDYAITDAPYNVWVIYKR